MVVCWAMFLLSFILSLASSESTILPVLNGISSILMFVNAYINHKKFIKDIRDSD